MSARVESPSIHGGVLGGAVMVAIVSALVIGGFAGSLITRSIVDRGVTARASGVALWDAGKLEAMEGRVLAAQVAAQTYPGFAAWDAGKLEAMEGRVLAAQVAAQTYPGFATWDAGKLEAMEGRVLAEQVSSARRFPPPRRR